MKAFKQKEEELTEFLELLEEDIENVRRVVKFCREKNIDAEFIVHGKAETVEESAKNTGVKKSSIVKTLVFKSGNKFLAVLCPGNRRVSESRLEEITGEKIRMAKPSEVKKETGYSVGGVSPFDLDTRILIEKSILDKESIKPAAGSRVVGAEVDPDSLSKAIEAEEEKIVE